MTDDNYNPDGLAPARKIRLPDQTRDISGYMNMCLLYGCFYESLDADAVCLLCRKPRPPANPVIGRSPIQPPQKR